MTKGIFNRFKVMDVSRGAVLTGHVAANVLTSLVEIAALIGKALLLRFDPAADFIDWLAAFGVVLLGFATSWLMVALGLAAKWPETAGMASVPLVMLQFFSSAIVPGEIRGVFFSLCILHGLGTVLGTCVHQGCIKKVCAAEVGGVSQ